jgi:hypothetical protein
MTLSVNQIKNYHTSERKNTLKNDIIAIDHTKVGHQS